MRERELELRRNTVCLRREFFLARGTIQSHYNSVKFRESRIITLIFLQFFS